MTSTEKILWSKLCNKQIDGLRFRNQHPIDRYIVDFYCHEIKLVIELMVESMKVKRNMMKTGIIILQLIRIMSYDLTIWR